MDGIKFDSLHALSEPEFLAALKAQENGVKYSIEALHNIGNNLSTKIEEYCSSLRKWTIVIREYK